MKGLATAWVMIVAVAGTILGIWSMFNAIGGFLPAISMLAGSGCLFGLGVMFIKGSR